MTIKIKYVWIICGAFFLMDCIAWVTGWTTHTPEAGVFSVALAATGAALWNAPVAST